MVNKFLRIISEYRTHILIVLLIYFILSILIFLKLSLNYEESFQSLTNITDGCHYYNSALNFSKNISFHPSVFVGDSFFPPGYPILLSLFINLKYSILLIIIVQVLINIISIIVFIFILNYVFENNIFPKIIGLYLFALNSLFIFNPFTLNTELLSTFLITASFYLLLKYFKKKNIFYFILFSTLFALVNYIRISTLPLIIIMPYIFYIEEREYSVKIKLFKNFFIKTSTYLLISGLILCPWMVRNYFYYDSFSFSNSINANLYLMFVNNFEKSKLNNNSLDKLKEIESNDELALKNDHLNKIINYYKIPYLKNSIYVIVNNPLLTLKKGISNLLKSFFGMNLDFLIKILENNYNKHLPGYSKFKIIKYLSFISILFVLFAIVNKILLILIITGIKLKNNIKYYKENKLIFIFGSVILIYIITMLFFIGIARFYLPYQAIIIIYLLLFNNRAINKFESLISTKSNR